MQIRENRLPARRRWATLIVVLGLVLIGVATFYGIGLFAVLKSGGFDVPDSESVHAQQVLETYLHGETPDIIVLMQADGLRATDEAFQSPAKAMLDRLGQRKEVSSVTSYYSTGRDSFLSKDQTETFALVQLSSTDESVKENDYQTLEPLLVAPPLHITLGGSVPFSVQLSDQIANDLKLAEMVTLPIVGILLVIVFRGVVAALLSLATGGITILCAFAVLRAFSNFTDISVFAINIVTMLGLGLAIDYALLIVTRFREELARDDQDVMRALRRTMSTAGRAVIFSSLTVSLSLSGLLLFPEMFLHSLGLGAIASVLLALFCALTILPALLALLGRYVNLLSIGRSTRRDKRSSGQVHEQGMWARIAETVMRWPVAIIIVVLAILLMLGWPFLSASFSTPDVRVLPADAEARVVSDRLTQDFAKQNSSIGVVIAITTSGDPLSESNLGKLDNYVQQIRQIPGVESIESVVTVDPSITLEQYVQLYQSQPLDSQLAGVKQQLVAGSHTKVIVHITPADLSPDAENIVSQIRRFSPIQGLTPLVGGPTAHQIDRFDNLKATIPQALEVIAASIFILLFLMTGSILVPLKAIVINLLSLTATFGALVWIFQQGHFQEWLNFQSLGSIDGTQPVLIFATAFGLSMDYEVFLLSRIKEEYDASGNNQRAVATGLQRTGGMITSAALLLAVVLGAFSTSHIIFIKEVGVGLAIAVLMDASIIRTLLVPATMRLLGRANWWAPGPLKALWRLVGLSEAANDEELAGKLVPGMALNEQVAGVAFNELTPSTAFNGQTQGTAFNGQMSGAVLNEHALGTAFNEQMSQAAFNGQALGTVSTSWEKADGRGWSPSMLKERNYPVMKLQGRVALVTGASRGIGRAIALALAAEGAAVVVNYRSREAQAKDVVEEIAQMGGKAIAMRADVSQYEQVTALVEKTLTYFGGLHILVNNAGIARDNLIYQMEPGDWLAVMQANFGGVFNGTKAVLPHFMSQRDGVIVNVSSVMGERGWVGEANYAASKGAINAFTRCSAMELARFNIRVNAVLPGFCMTDLVEGLVTKDGGKGILKQVPIRSFARPEDIAHVVTFLASPDSQYMIGMLVPVDGGASAVLGVGSPRS